MSTSVLSCAKHPAWYSLFASLQVFICDLVIKRLDEVRELRSKNDSKGMSSSTLVKKRNHASHDLLAVKTRHLFISYLGGMLKHRKTSTENISLLLLLLFRRIGEAAPAVDALFPVFCGAKMRIARKVIWKVKRHYLPTSHRPRPCAF